MSRLRLLATLLLFACGPTSFGIWIEPPPEFPPEPPVPEAFTGEAAPDLVPAGMEGLSRAPSVDPHLYYYAPEDLWYRYWKKSWYQAFRWNGAWFPPSSVPAALRGGPPATSPPR